MADYRYRQWGTLDLSEQLAVEWYNTCRTIGLSSVRIPIGSSALFLPDRSSNPSKHKLLTTPPPKKIHWGIILLGEMMMLQGVGHPISCLGVCYANDLPKRELYGIRAYA